MVNDLKRPVIEIMASYKKRWQIELFFPEKSDLIGYESQLDLGPT